MVKQWAEAIHKLEMAWVERSIKDVFDALDRAFNRGVGFGGTYT